MKNNIFTYSGPRGELVEIFYKLLMSRKVIAYVDVLIEYDGGTLSSQNVTGHHLYKTLKHVVPELVETLQSNGYGVLSIQKGRTTSYQYIGSSSTPLENIKFKATLKERFEMMDLCIKNKQPVIIEYKPFNRASMEIVFHPHLLQIFNDRYFVFGVSEKEGCIPFRKFNIALDRIQGEIRTAGSNHPYIPVEEGEYSYLANIVGVTLEEGAKLTTIRIRAVDNYTFGRLVTKPLHASQRVIVYPDWKAGIEYGDIEINVIPNLELVGQILSYGSFLKVLSPESFRDRIIDELNKATENYIGSYV